MRNDVEIFEERQVLELEDREDICLETRALIQAAQTNGDLEAAEDRAEILRDLLGWHDSLIERMRALRDGDEDQREGIELALGNVARALEQVTAVLEQETRWISFLQRRMI